MLNLFGPANITFIGDQPIAPGLMKALADRGLTVAIFPLVTPDICDAKLTEADVLVFANGNKDQSNPAMPIFRKIRENEDLRSKPTVCWGFSPRELKSGAGKSSGLLFFVGGSASDDEVRRMIECAIRSSGQFQSLLRDVAARASAFGLIRSGVFEIKNLREAENLATMLSRACPEPSIAAFALIEILVNAIEHGNLGISNAEKVKLLEEGRLQEEIERRNNLPENAGKVVTVTFSKNEGTAQFIIADAGEGFDWRSYTCDSVLASDKLGGRGITLACALDRVQLTYLGNGNTAQLVIG